MSRFRVSSYNQVREKMLRGQQEELTAIDELEKSLAPINRRTQTVYGQPTPPEPEEPSIDPIDDFLTIQDEGRRRGLEVSLVADQPYGEQFKHQFGRNQPPGYLVKGKNINNVSLNRKDLEEYISERPLKFDKEEEDVDESREGLLGRIAREAKSFFIGDTPAETALNIGLMMIPAAIPLKGIHLGLKAVRLIGKTTPTVVEHMKEVKLLVKFVQDAGAARLEQTVERSAELGRRVKQGKWRYNPKTKKRGVSELELLKRGRRALRGELPVRETKVPLVSRPSPEGITLGQENRLLKVIRQSKADFFSRENAGFALHNLVHFGKIPTQSEIKALEKTLGPILGKELRKLIPKKKRIEEGLIDILSLPKSIVSSFDLSAPFRQGFFLIGHYKEFYGAAKAMFRAFGDEQFALKVTEDIGKMPTHKVARKAGLFLSDSVNNAEEAFMSKFANNIPGIGRSARAYTTFLNKLRADVFENQMNYWTSTSYKYGTKDVDGLARWINRATGRGSLGPLEQFRGALNVGLFSPAYVMSRFQIPLSLIGETKAVRSMVAKDLLAAGGVSATALALMGAAGAKIGFDPRSADFGKGRIGNTRIDLGAGELQVAKLIAQVFTGKRVTSVGKEEKEDRLNIAARFLQYKLSPTAGVVRDIAVGQTFLGEDFEVADLATFDQIKERLAPLFLQDLEDAIEENGLARGFALALPAGFGVGVQTYAGLWDRRKEAFAEMFPGEDFQTVHHKRGRALIRMLDSHPAVIEELEKLRTEKSIHNQEYNDVARRRYETINNQREEEFRGSILDGRIQGKALRDLVQKFNRDRFALSNALFKELEGDIYADAFDAAADIQAIKYLSADLDEDPVTGKLDFEGRDKARTAILQESRMLGIPIDYIMGKGPTSFRGTRFKDPVVRAVMDRYDEDIEILRKYWDLESVLLDQMPMADEVRMQILRAEAMGESPARIQNLKRHPQWKKFEKARTKQRETLRMLDPTIEARLYFWGYIENITSLHTYMILNRLSLDYLTNQE